MKTDSGAPVSICSGQCTLKDRADVVLLLLVVTFELKLLCFGL